MGILEGEGGSGAILPGLGAQVVVEARSSSHGLGVEVGRERAILPRDVSLTNIEIPQEGSDKGNRLLITRKQCKIKKNFREN